MAKTVLVTKGSMNSTPTQEEISARAYEIYLQEGCVQGRDMEHWLQAEQHLRARTLGNETSDSMEMTDAPSQRSARSNGALLPASVVTPSAPIAQATRSTTPRRSAGKRETAIVKS